MKGMWKQTVQGTSGKQFHRDFGLGGIPPHLCLSTAKELSAGKLDAQAKHLAKDPAPAADPEAADDVQAAKDKDAMVIEVDSPHKPGKRTIDDVI